jgi:hypothetical protein
LPHTIKDLKSVFLWRWGNTGLKFLATPCPNHGPNLIAEVRLGLGSSANRKCVYQALPWLID